MTGWDTRAQSGLRAPRAISTQINPTHGVAMHYGGGGPFRRSSHADCRAIWRSWQNWHMSPDNKNNYNDIAYNLGVCHHDIVLEGRSTRTRPRIRGGANGNFTVNGNRYSVVAIWGSNDGAWPDSLKRAWRFARDWLRQQDSRTGTGLTPHSAMASTSCPGAPGRAWLAAGAPIPGGTTPPPPPPPPGSWLDMATKDDVKAAVREVLRERRPLSGLTADTLPSAWNTSTDYLAAYGAMAASPTGRTRQAGDVWKHPSAQQVVAELAALREAVGEILEHDSSNPLTKADLEEAIERGMQRVRVEVSVVEDEADED